MSGYYISREDFLLRRVIEIEKSGVTIELKTAFATLPEAFTEYYINSEFDHFVSVRSENDFESVDAATTNSLFNNIGDPGQSAFSLSPIFEFVGNIDIEAIHPHTAYKYFGPCMGDSDCFNAIEKVDANNNHFWDIVDDFFEGNLESDSLKNGLYTISFKNFGIKKVGISYGTKNGTGNPVGFDITDTPEQIKNKMVLATKQDKKNQPPNGLGLKYFPTPATFWGGLTVTIPVAPILSFDMNSSMSAELIAVFPERIDVRMGHLNWNSTFNPSLDIYFKFTQYNHVVNASKMFENPSVNLGVGLDGNATLNFGVAIGAAITAGEGNNAGVSLGALVEMSNYYSVSGSTGVRATDLFNWQNGGSLTWFGKGCVDMGLDYDFSVFFDANLGPFFGDYFDKKFTAPKNFVGLSKFSMTQFLPNYSPGEGMCFEITACDATVPDIMNFGLLENNVLQVEFMFSNPVLANELYRLEIKGNGANSILNGPFEYGKLYEVQIIDAEDEIISALVTGTLTAELEDINVGCKKTVDNSEIGFLVSCDNPPYRDLVQELTGTHSIIDIVGDEVYYFNRQAYLLLGDTKATKAEIEAFLGDYPCVNSTGYLLPEGNGYKSINSNKTFVWIPVLPNGDDVLVIEFENMSGSGKIKKFTTTRASESLMAVVVSI